MIEAVQQLAKTLAGVVRVQAETFGLIIDRKDLLVAYDQQTGRFVITFEVNVPEQPAE